MCAIFFTDSVSADATRVGCVCSPGCGAGAEPATKSVDPVVQRLVTVLAVDVAGGFVATLLNEGTQRRHREPFRVVALGTITNGKL